MANMFFCDVPLQNKRHLCHAHPWPRFAKYPRCIQKELQISCKQRVHPKINIMDNQATKAIKLYLTPWQCCLQLVEPGNHRVNATERAIQTFKNRFIGALGTTDVDFPIQLWDKLAPQVQDSINLL
jgi:hypothetical protein